MAQRRMFSRDLVESDEFLDLSMTAQCLYFHLSLNADDDGMLNNPRTIMRMIGCNNADMTQLVEKGYIKYFENSGVVGVVHWRINNQIRNDRKKETVFTAELAEMSATDNQTTTKRQPTDNQTATDGRPSIVQYSIGKNSIDKVSSSVNDDNNASADVYSILGLTNEQRVELQRHCGVHLDTYLTRVIQRRQAHPEDRYDNYNTIIRWYDEDKAKGKLNYMNGSEEEWEAFFEAACNRQ